MIKRGPQDLAIRNPALTLFIIKLVRILNGISFNNGNKCVVYFNFIADLHISSFKRVEFRRRAEDKVLYKFY